MHSPAHRAYSGIVVDGADRAPSRAMLHAVGFSSDDFSRSQIGIASTWNTVTPCNMHIDKLALAARDDSDGFFGAISDEHILLAHRILSAEVGIFVEPASAISVAGLLERAEAGAIPKGSRVVLTVTGHGLKDPQWALRTEDGSDVTPTVVHVDTKALADVLGLVAAPAAHA